MGHDVGMIELAGDLELGVEPPEGGVAKQALVAHLGDRAHPAAAPRELLADRRSQGLVGADSLTGTSR